MAVKEFNQAEVEIVLKGFGDVTLGQTNSTPALAVLFNAVAIEYLMLLCGMNITGKYNDIFVQILLQLL